jgi:hypothetical protein
MNEMDFPYEHAVTPCNINGRTPYTTSQPDVLYTVSGPPVRHYPFHETKCKRKDAEGDVHLRRCSFAEQDDGGNELSEEIRELD